VRIPGSVQFSGQQTASRTKPSQPWSLPGPGCLSECIPFILPQIGLLADYFNPDFVWRSMNTEQNRPCMRLMSVKMKANRKKALPALANGQLWKTENAYIQIVELGKRLIDYRMMRELGQARRTQTSSIETMEQYLKTNEARLVKGNSRN
jgi:hypothetical protein